MRKAVALTVGILGLSIAVATGAARADDGPFIAQPGKDAPYVPTPQSVVAAMLEIASVGPQDFVIDLGSGDGRIVLTAVREFGADRAVGVELDGALVARSRQAAAEAGLGSRATFRQENIFETDLRGATVVTMYLMPEANMQLRPQMLRLPPGTRVVSHAFHMQDWRADKTVVVHEDDGGGAVRLWIVPADARGRWTGRIGDAKTGQAFRLDLTQTFQDVAGTVNLGGADLPIRDAHLEGDRIAFAVEEQPGQPARRFEGRIRGNAIEGRIHGAGPDIDWRATRPAGAGPNG